MRAWLIDTGPLVAYLDSKDPAHAEVADCLGPFSGDLYTTSAVVTEAMHLVGRSAAGPALLADFIAASRTIVFDFCQAKSLRGATEKMEKYSNLPMDFADATLVLLAEKLRVFDLLTLDRRGFSAFRCHGGEAFHLVLDSS